MVLSVHFEYKFEEMIKEAKASVCADIDAKAKSLRKLFLWELATQREELLDTMAVFGRKGNENDACQQEIVMKAEPTDNSHQETFNLLPNNRMPIEHQQTKEPNTSSSNQSEDTQTSNRSNQPQSQQITLEESVNSSNQLNLQAIKEEEVDNYIEYLDSDDDGNCSCSDCQSGDNTVPENKDNDNNAGEVDKAQALEKEDNNEILELRKRRKITHPSNNGSNSDPSQPGPSGVCARSTTKPQQQGKCRPSKKYQTKSLTCIVINCRSTLPSKEAFNEHIVQVHNIAPYPCLLPNCTEGFTKMSELLEHRRSGHLSDMNQWQCGHCGTFIRSSQPFVDHLYNAHYFGTFQCSQCSFVGPNRTAVTAHYTLKHYRFICPHPGCGEAFDTGPHLRRHSRSHKSTHTIQEYRW